MMQRDQKQNYGGDTPELEFMVPGFKKCLGNMQVSEGANPVQINTLLNGCRSTRPSLLSQQLLPFLPIECHV